jgi:hypothetical protein
VGASAKRHSRQPRSADSRGAPGAKLGPVGRREGEPADLGVAGLAGGANRSYTWSSALAFMGRVSSGRAGGTVVGFAVTRRAAASTGVRRTGMGLTRSGRRRSSAEPRSGLERTGTRCSGPTSPAARAARATSPGGPGLGITIAGGTRAARRFAARARLGRAPGTGPRRTRSAFGSLVGISIAWRSGARAACAVLGQPHSGRSSGAFVEPPGRSGLGCSRAGLGQSGG